MEGGRGKKNGEERVCLEFYLAPPDNPR